MSEPMEDKSLERSMIDDIKKRLEVMQVIATIPDDITEDGNGNIGDFYAHDVNYLLTQNATLQSQITALKSARGSTVGQMACDVVRLEDEVATIKELLNGESLHTETEVSLVDDVRDLVKERDRLTYAIGEWKREEVLWKEREADLQAKLSVCKEAIELAVEISTNPGSKDPFNNMWKWHYRLKQALAQLQPEKENG